MTTPEVIDLLYEILSTAPELAAIREWNKAMSLVTLASPGGAIGVEKEVFSPYTREEDEVNAYISITVWVKHANPVAGEAAVRDLAQVIRMVLIQNRTLGGAVDDSFVHGIEYATAEGGKSLLLHLAELDYRVTYYADRVSPPAVHTVAVVENEFDYE